MPHITNKSHSFKADKSENHVTPTTRFRSLKYNHFLSAVNTWRHQCQRPALSVAEQPHVYYVSHREHVGGYVGLLAMHQLLPVGSADVHEEQPLEVLTWLLSVQTPWFDLFTTLIGKNRPETTRSTRFKRYQVFVKYTFALVILGSWDETQSPKDTKRQNHLTACSSCSHLVTNIPSSTLSSDFRVTSFHTLNASQFNRNSSFIFMNLLLLHKIKSLYLIRKSTDEKRINWLNNEGNINKSPGETRCCHRWD